MMKSPFSDVFYDITFKMRSFHPCFLLRIRMHGEKKIIACKKKAIRLPDRFQKLLSFSSSDKIQYRTQPRKQSGSFAENPVQLLYPARQFSHICHSISCKPFLHRYLNKNEHIWQLISLAIAKTRFRCYHMVKEISFNPPASKATAERRVFLCKGVRSRGEIRPDQKAQHQ